MTERMKRISLGLFLGLFLAGTSVMPIVFGHGIAMRTTRLVADGGAPPPPPPPWPVASGQILSV